MLCRSLTCSHFVDLSSISTIYQHFAVSAAKIYKALDKAYAHLNDIAQYVKTGRMLQTQGRALGKQRHLLGVTSFVQLHLNGICRARS